MSEFHFLCGEVNGSAQAGAKRLSGSGPNQNINLEVSDISSSMLANLPDLLLDLLEVAAYVYCADQQSPRGSDTLPDYGEDWRRQMHFTIPVREVDVWQRPEVNDALCAVLSFLSDDFYEFTFVKAHNPTADRNPYFRDQVDRAWAPDRVALFSGGLDSLAGAVDAISAGERVALVGHYSSSKVFGIQRSLVGALEDRDLAASLFYVPVRITNKGQEAADNTQRTRSFLFASLGLVVAQMFGQDQLTFYENGVMSLNVPIAGDVIGSRATRTTHPKVIRGFERLFSSLLAKPIDVLTPFQWVTKAEVISTIVSRGFGGLISITSSCTRPRSWSTEQVHCGSCSQCIDRRVAIVAGGYEQLDPAGGYAVDVMTGVRTEERDVRMALAYVRSVRSMSQVSRTGVIHKYPGIAQALGSFKHLSAAEAQDKCYDLLIRNAAEGIGAIQKSTEEHARALAAGELPTGSLLQACSGRSFVELPRSEEYRQAVRAYIETQPQPICEFAVDEIEERIMFRGGLELIGSDYKLVSALLERHRSAKKRGQAPEPISADDLGKQLGKDEPSVRKHISRLRDEVTNRLGADQGLVLGENDFVQNVDRHGYRLAPEVREVTLFDLRNLPMSHSPSQNVTHSALIQRAS
jgi:7-cyano-7-deazaguanine synthase in queuosine biosynthesis